jgi:AcrR family transcriptional regulator
MVSDLVMQTKNMKPELDEGASDFDLKNPKVKLILKGAAKVFLNEGYDVATTDLIARTAGVSKATLYVYFKSKEALLQAMVKYETARILPAPAWQPESEPMDVYAVLRRIAIQHTHFVLNKSASDLYRLVMAQATRFPEIGRIFYDSGPRRFRAQLADVFDVAIAQGHLDIPDVDLAASHFLSLILGALPFNLFISIPIPPQEEVDAFVDSGLRVFLRAYSKAP